MVEAINLGRQPPRPPVEADDEDFSYENRIDAMLVQESEQWSQMQEDDTTLLQLDEEQEEYMTPMQELWVSYLQYGEEGPENAYYVYDEEKDAITSRQEVLAQRAAIGDKLFKQRLAQDVRVEVKAGGQDLTPEQRAAREKKQKEILARAQAKKDKEEGAKNATNGTCPAPPEATAPDQRTLHIVPYSHVSDLHLADQASPDKGARVGPVSKQKQNHVFVGSVRDILNSTIEELLSENQTSGNRTFTFSDLKYFKRWYEKQPDPIQDKIKQLVHDGRLDLIAGSWMPVDEAITQADAILDSFMVGQQFLQKEFEIQPRVSWQLDGNGVSSGYARLMKGLGIDMLIHSSISSTERKEMRAKQGLMQVWRTSERNFGKRQDVLAVALDQVTGGGSSYCWPMGFWADANYLIDTPLKFKKNQTDPAFNATVKALYAEVASALNNSRSVNIMRPFGCDMAYVDASVNYVIMDELVRVWKELGYDKDIVIEYSTPTRFYERVKIENEMNKTNIVEPGGWPVRRDDTFPYAAASKDGTAFFSGYYSSRPILKEALRRLTSTYHSMSRMLTLQVVRDDLEAKDPSHLKAGAIAFQRNVMELIADLQSYDAIAGTAKERLAADYLIRAHNGLKDVRGFNSELIEHKLHELYGIEASGWSTEHQLVKLDAGVRTTTWSKQKEILLIVQNPSTQRRREVIEVEVPYFNLTLTRVHDTGKKTDVKFEKYLPRLWQNRNMTYVESLIQFHVDFEPTDVFQVFVLKDLGVIRKKNAPPANFPFAASRIWNLNLPVFLPRFYGDIDHFQPNFRQIWPGNAIRIGTKTLQFLEIIKTNKEKKQHAAEAKAKRDKNEPTSAQFDWNVRDTGNTTSTLDPQNSTNATNSTKLDNTGAAVFLFTDTATGVKQKFAVNLRYYIGASEANQEPKNYQQGPAGLSQVDKRVASGLYEFKVNSTKTKNGQRTPQKSYKYGKINLKRCRFRQNEKSGQMLLLWEQVYGPPRTEKKSSLASNRRSDTTNSTDAERIRASIRIDMNDVDSFVRFHVSTNEVPIENDKTGKDIVVDWHMLDGFDSAGKLWVDANGLQMVQKEVNKRAEYEFAEEDKGAAANFYPITSAIAIKDHSGAAQHRQVLIMTDRPAGASAGLRDHANIEIMHQRRYKRSLAPTFKGKRSQQAGALNELDKHGRGVQVAATYYMMVTDVTNQYDKKIESSHQRALQRRLDQPLLVTYARSYKVIGKPVRAGATYDRALYSFMNEQLKAAEAMNMTLANHRLRMQAENDTAAIPNVGGKTASDDSDTNASPESAKFTVDKNYVPNRAAKESKTFKIMPYAVHNNEVLVRLTNLEDKFDGLAHVNKTIMINLNEWAREFYLEANLHNKPEDGELSKILGDLKVVITEMTLSGSIAKDGIKKAGPPTESEVEKRGPPCNLHPENSTEAKAAGTATPTGSGLVQKKYFEDASDREVIKHFNGPGDERGAIVRDGAYARNDINALKQKYITTTWLTLSDPEVDDVGSGPFSLAEASIEPEDRIYDGISFSYKETDEKNVVTADREHVERVYEIVLGPQDIRVFSIRYIHVDTKKEKEEDDD